MKLKVSPVIHGRTKNNDFPGSLLVAPSDFDNNDILWARERITDSTRFFDLVSNEGRRLVFSNSKVIVSGISIKIADLYKLCNKEPQYATVEQRRTNYAFIGFAIPKSEITSVFDVPYTLFLELYEKWMKELWETPFQENGMSCAKAEYVQNDFHEVSDVCDNIKSNNNGKPIIVDSSVAPVECIAAKAMEFAIQSNEFAFCSNLTIKSAVADSCFNMVTSSKAASIAAGIPGSILVTEKYVQVEKKPPVTAADNYTDKTDQISKTEIPSINEDNSHDKSPDINKTNISREFVDKPIIERPVIDITVIDRPDIDNPVISETDSNSKRKVCFIIVAAVIAAIVLFLIFGLNEDIF